MRDAIRSIFVVCMNNGLGIGIRPKTVPACFKLYFDLEIIVDLTVKNDQLCSIFVVYRLLPSLETDDRQPPHAECGSALDSHTRLVPSPMRDHTAHRVEPGYAPFRAHA